MISKTHNIEFQPIASSPIITLCWNMLGKHTPSYDGSFWHVNIFVVSACNDCTIASASCLYDRCGNHILNNVRSCIVAQLSSGATLRHSDHLSFYVLETKLPANTWQQQRFRETAKSGHSRWIDPIHCVSSILNILFYHQPGQKRTSENSIHNVE